MGRMVHGPVGQVLAGDVDVVCLATRSAFTLCGELVESQYVVYEWRDLVNCCELCLASLRSGSG